MEPTKFESEHPLGLHFWTRLRWLMLLHNFSLEQQTDCAELNSCFSDEDLRNRADHVCV